MASLFHTFPLLRQAAPKLPRGLSTCRQCLRRSSTKATSTRRPIYPSVRQTPFLKAFRSQTTHAPAPTESPLFSLSKSIYGSSSSTFPQTSARSVAYFLLGSATSVFGIVIFGGLTRLTESGLSITEWRPVTGSLPPMNQDDWDSEFQKYRASPEAQILNSRMTLEEFKKIYWMEWTHRLWGRVVGVTFLLPSMYFIARRRVSARMAINIAAIAAGIGFQGVLGWWMVKSGLKDDLFAPGSQPRVSQYRLTAHLGTAFAVFLGMLWNGLSILRENKLLQDPVAGLRKLDTLRSAPVRPLRIAVGALAVLVFTTALSGALVAGLDAGLIYNDFPWMGVGLTPPRAELWDKFYSRDPDGRDIWWRNMLENPSLVQLDHRIMATVTFTAVLALWAYARYSRRLRAVPLPPEVRKGVQGVTHFLWLQVTLGITTLWYLVPVTLAAMHQANALLLLGSVVVLGSRVWVPRRLHRLVEQRAKQVKAGANFKIHNGVNSRHLRGETGVQMAF